MAWATSVQFLYLNPPLRKSVANRDIPNRCTGEHTVARIVKVTVVATHPSLLEIIRETYVRA